MREEREWLEGREAELRATVEGPLRAGEEARALALRGEEIGRASCRERV